jgi:hypothetical protein
MTYIDEISSALVRVLTHACDGPPDRFAGYAANAEFWVGEVRHCMDVIDGYDKRFHKLKAATVGGREFVPPPRRSTQHGERAASKRAVREIARRFLARCEKTRGVSEAELIEHCRRLDIGMPF